MSLLYIYSQNTTVWARYKRKERVLYRQNTPYIRKTPIRMPIYKKNTYIGLYKSSLPNLKYCYIKRATSFSHLVLPLALATYFNHFIYIGFIFITLGFAFYFNHFIYISIFICLIIYSFSLLFYLYFLITFSSHIFFLSICRVCLVSLLLYILIWLFILYIYILNTPSLFLFSCRIFVYY